jgi:hypothetical protein
MLEAEQWEVLWGSVVIGIKEEKSSTVCIGAAGFPDVMAHSRLVRVLKLMNRCSFNFQFFFAPR